MKNASSIFKDWTLVTITDDVSSVIPFNYSKLTNMFEWCDNNVGEESVCWNWTYNISYSDLDVYDFHFKKSNDAVIFKLIWG